MSRKVYDDGQLVEEWDDDTTTYRRFDDGEVVEERPYSVTEAEVVERREAEVVRASAAQALRDQHPSRP
jgi:hypothetical protein